MRTLYQHIVIYILVIFSASIHCTTQKKTTLIFTGDMPLIENKEHGDYRRLASYLNLIRSTNDTSFFLFGGGSIGPSPMSSFDKGSHIIDILNTLEPDAMGVSKREFSYSEDELSQRAYEAAFPIIGTNIYDLASEKVLDGLQTSTLITKGAISIGVVSMVNPAVVEEYLLNRIKLIPRRQAIVDESKKLRAKGADVVVLLYSVPNDIVEPLINETIIDIAFMVDKAYSQTRNYELIEHPNHYYLQSPGEVIQVELSVSSNEKVYSKGESVSLKDFPLDEYLSNQSSGYVNRLERLLNVDVASVTGNIDTRKLSIRTRETVFGNLISDAIREFFSSDIAVLNSGSVRGDKIYKQNTVWTMRDVITELPFRSRLVQLEATGKQIKEALENGVSQLTDVKGRFPLVSGLSFSFNKSLEVGQRITSVSINNAELDPNKIYSVATSEYLANGGDGYEAFIDTTKIKNGLRIKPLLSDVLIMHLKRTKGVVPKIENRVVEINE